MKIGIISLGIHGTHENYGAILQMWAFKEYLAKKFNAEVEVIDYYGLSCKNILRKQNIGFAKKVYHKIRYIMNGGFLLKKRYRHNEKFIQHNFILSPAYNVKSIEKAVFDYDFLISESDVIWDPTFRNTGFDNAYFLNLPNMRKAGKRIVYAASMGDIKYSKKDRSLFVENIKNLDMWSVREMFAKDYIYNEFKLTCESLIDPTLLLNEKEYDQFLNHKFSKERYVLVYMPAEENKKMIQSAKAFAKKHGISVKYIIRKSKKYFLGNVYLDLGVEDFLSIIKSADIIFCDSFHAVCFSIIFRKQFLAFLREDGKKVVDLCKRFGLEERIIDNKIQRETKDIDYDELYSQRLKIERQKSEDWLKKALTVD